MCLFSFFNLTHPRKQWFWYYNTEWTQKKAQKSREYALWCATHLKEIYVSVQKFSMLPAALRRKGEKWTTAQYNFTDSIRGSAIEEAWEDQLKRLGVDQKKTRAVIQRQAICKTLEVSGVILR